jgi:hypothetical protein
MGGVPDGVVECRVAEGIGVAEDRVRLAATTVEACGGAAASWALEEDDARARCRLSDRLSFCVVFEIKPKPAEVRMRLSHHTGTW